MQASRGSERRGRAEYERMSREDLIAELRARSRLGAVDRAQVAVSEALLEASPPSAQRVLQTIVEQARELVDAEFAALGLDGSEDHRFDPWVFAGIPEDQAIVRGAHPRRAGLLAVASSTPTSIRLRDLREHPAFRGFPPGHPEMTSFLGVPIRRRDQAIGTLYLANKIGAEEFTEEDERAVEVLAGRVAVTMEIARLRDQEAKGLAWLREVVDRMPEAVLLVDGETGISLNQAATALFDSVGRPAGDVPIHVITPDGRPVPASELPHIRASQGEHIAGLELILQKPGGARVPLVVNAGPVREGKPGSAVAVYRDVSAVKQLERAREEWMSLIAHDLRQPTSVISFSGQILSRCGEGLGQREQMAVKRICSSSSVLNRMIDDLLDATLIEAQRLKIKREDVDVVALVKEVTDRAAPLGDHPVRVRAPAEAIIAPVDPDRLGEVLMNLLSNAAKYSEPASEIAVEVDRAGDEVEVAVSNRGKGLTAEEALCVFQRFYRTGAAEAGPCAGLGLGLYISKGLIEAHGGRIWAESTPGETTSFRLRLPAKSG